MTLIGLIFIILKSLNSALFGLDTEFDPEFVQNLIFDTITNNEPRARVLSVSVALQPENNSLDTTVEFQVVNTKEIIALDVSLARVR